MENKQKTFIFFGIVGSGKGTQVELLNKYIKENNIIEDVVLMSPGDEYRKIVNKDTYLSKIVKERLEKGFLQPDFLTTSLLTNILISNIKENTAIIADGFPRTIAQSENFYEMMKFFGRRDIHIIYIELTKEESIKRMKLRGRDDDTDEGILNRFNEYVNNVIPSMNYFNDKESYIIHKINGEQSIENVHRDIIKELGL
jgi:adenylate kinase